MAIDLNKIFNIIKLVKDTSGTTAKLNLLSSYKDVPGLKETFKLLLCQSYAFNITSWDAGANLHIVGLFPDSKVIECLEEAGKSRSKSYARSALLPLYGVFSGTQEKYVNYILARRPDCGIGPQQVEKIWPGLLSRIIYQGAKAEDKEGIRKMYSKADSYGVYVDTKYDGLHAIHYAAGPNGAWEVRTRQNAPLPKPDNWSAWIAGILLEAKTIGLTTKSGFYIPSEALVLDDNYQYIPRAIGNPIVQAGTSDRVIYRVWDFLTYEEVTGGKCRPLWQRKGDLCTIFAQLSKRSVGLQLFQIAESKVFYSFDAGWEYGEKQIQSGAEGVIHKLGSSTFKEGKQPTHWKQTFSCDAEAVVIDWTPHTTKPGCIGALVCRIDAGACNGPIMFNVGSGIPHNLLSDPDAFLGKIITVTFKDVTKAKGKNAVMSLSCPTFQGFYEGEDHDTSDTVFRRLYMRRGYRHELDEGVFVCMG